MAGIALPIDGVATPAADNRVADGALYLGRTDRPLGAVSGVRPGSEPTVTFSGLTATLSPFVGVADPGTSLAVGAYRVAFKAAETFNINAADATNTRLDRVDVMVPDDPAGASPLSAQIKYTAGVASASPAIPAAPARSFFLGTITVPASGSGSPSWSTTGMNRTVASGGVLPIDSPLYFPAHPYVGQYVHDLSTGLQLRYKSDGTWGPGGMPRGKVIYSGSRTTQDIGNAGGLLPMAGWQTTSPAFSRGTTISGNGITVTYAGDYLISSNITFEPDTAGTGRRGIKLCINGAEPAHTEQVVVPGASGASATTSVSLTTMVRLNAGDVISIIPLQSSGGILRMTMGSLEAACQG